MMEMTDVVSHYQLYAPNLGVEPEKKKKKLGWANCKKKFLTRLIA